MDEHQARIRELDPELVEIRAKFRNDPQGLQQATVDLYAANQINAFSGCGRVLLGQLIFNLILLLGSRGRRTVRDRVTGSVVIETANRPLRNWSEGLGHDTFPGC